MASDTPIGDRVYIRGDSGAYVWRGRINGKSKKVTIRHPKTGVTAKVTNMSKAEARRIGREITTDAETAGGRYFTVAGKITVRGAWDIYMKREGDKLSSAPEKRSHFKNHIGPAIGDKGLLEVTRMDCASIIDRALEGAHAKGLNGNTAVNLQKNMKAFFNWCADRGYGATGLEASPMAAMKAKPIDVALTQRPSRSLTRPELVWLFQAFEQYMAEGRSDGRAQRIRTVAATELLLRSVCRREDVFASVWGWVQPDGFHVPETKMGYALLVPLTPTMRTLLGERPDKAKDDTPIFGVTMDYMAHEFLEIRKAMTKIAAADGSNADFVSRKLDDKLNPNYFSLHDLRDTAKFWLAKPTREDGEKRFSSETREAMLNHREQGIAAIYNSELDSEDYLLAQRTVAGAWLDAFYDEIKAEALQPEALAA